MSVKTFDRLQKSDWALDSSHMLFRVYFQFVFGFILAGFVLSCAPVKKSANQFNGADLNLSENIIGGYDLSRNQKINTSLAAIMNMSSLGSFSICTGTFIEKNIILTAAHCVSEDAADLVIKIGNSIFDDEKTKTVKAVKVLKHPEYQKQMNDLALILIENDQDIQISPVSLATELDLKNKNNFILFGYGVNTSTESGAADFQGSGDLRKLIMSKKYIAHRVTQNEMSVKSKYILDQTHGFGVCHGDSGGPALILNQKNKYVLVAVASGVYESIAQDDCTNKSEYTDILQYRSWILQSISDFNGN
jgi:secreted trypsin-like serine protease